MSARITAAVIAVGTELVTGKIQDSHGKYLGTRLTESGFHVSGISMIPDDERIGIILDQALGNTDILILTGGLGPTSDDITRDLVARSAGVELKFHQDLWDGVKAAYTGCSASSRTRQYYIPEGFEVLRNCRGTAPGFYGVIKGTLLVSLPGPPVEMRDMFERSVMPVLSDRFSLELPESLTVSCFLIGESNLEDMCSKLNMDGITWGTRVQPYRISLYIYGETPESRKAFLRALKSEYGDNLFVEGDVEAAELLFNALKAENKLFCTAESITGGLISKIITDIPGSSGVFWGSFITYTDSAKNKCLGITQDTLDKSGAVSRETVTGMAENGLAVSGTDLCVAVSGYAGGNSGIDEDTGLVWIAVKTAGCDTYPVSFRFRGSRDIIRRKTAVAAMLLSETALRAPERLDSCQNWQYS